MESRPTQRAVFAGAVAASVLLLPLAGAWMAGRIPASLFTFPPPLEIPVAVPQCSLIAAIVIAIAAIALAWWFGSSRRDRVETPAQTPTPGRHRKPFPAWGWLAGGWTVLWWWLAWTRPAWATAVQSYTFFPLWLGVILTVNALTWCRSGHSTMCAAPRQWLAQFFISAAFWWGFEWLNRFVQNWHYLGAEEFDAAGYALHATICFSTVLPAVLAVRELLATFPGWLRWCCAGPKCPWLADRRTGATFVTLAITALLLTGAKPQLAYAALWSAPLFLAVGAYILASRPGWWSELEKGDWRTAGSWAASALVCGFFWEMWNFHSDPKWIYTVPHLDCLRVFAMPLPGYLGYLPFGLECAVVAQWWNEVARGRMSP